MALENAQFLNQVIAANPADTDPGGQGSAQIRLLKSVLLATFPNLNAVVNGTPAQFNTLTGWVSGGGMTLPAPTDTTSVSNGTGAAVTLLGQSSGSDYQLGITGNNLTVGYGAPVASGSTAAPTYTTTLTYTGSTGVLNVAGSSPDLQVNGNSVQVPVGSVIMYSGSVANLPANWHLCDGTNGTPDLRDQFIIGAGKTYTTGQAGGSTTISVANLPAHTHTITDPGHTHTSTVSDPGHTHGVNDPGHIHSYAATPDNSPSAGYWNPGYGGAAPATQTTNSATTGISIRGASTGVSVNLAGAATGITLQTTGSGSAFLPPYYALAFIMRIK